MSSIRKIWKQVVPYLVGVLFLCGCVLYVVSYNLDRFKLSAVSPKRIEKLENAIHAKQLTMEKLANRWLNHIEANPESPFVDDKDFTKLDAGSDILLYGFKGDSLAYWSSKRAVTLQQLREVDTVARYLKMGSSWGDVRKDSDEEGTYIAKAYQREGYRVVALLSIRYDYTYQNAFLRNHFNPELPFPPSTFAASLGDGGYTISSVDGHPIFSLGIDVTKGENKQARMLRWLSLYLTILALIYVTVRFSKRVNPFISSLLFIAAMVAIRLWLYKNPYILGGEGLLFSPLLFAASDLLPSLGDLLLNALFVFLIVAVTFRNRFSIISYISGKPRWLVTAALLVVCILSAVLAVSAHSSFISLIVNSNIPLEPYHLSSISVYTVVAYSILALLFGSLFLFQLFTFKFVIQSNHNVWSVLAVSLATVAALALAYNRFSLVLLAFILLYMLAGITAFMYLKGRLKKVSYITLVVFLLSVYSLALVAVESTRKEREERKVIALNLSNQRDPIAEVLFRDLSEKLEADAVIADLIQNPAKNYDNIYERLANSYFSGYFTRYTLRQINICSSVSMMSLYEEGMDVNCWEFYSDLIKRQGRGSTGIFTFLNSNNGRISYTGMLKYPSDNGADSIALFIDLISKSESQQIGYPELLLEQKDIGKDAGIKYSYAKYYDGKRVSVFGDYSYGYELKKADLEQLEEGGYKVYLANGFSHLLMQYDSHNTVIVGIPELRFSDLILSFSYLFLFFFVNTAIILVIGGFPLSLSGRRTTFKRRLTLILLGVLTVAFIATGISMLWYNIRKLQKTNINGIEERMGMVLSEFDQWYAVGMGGIANQQANLTYWLVELSNIYKTDINIYKPSGELLASSRPELFERGLQGERIDPKAYRTLKYSNLSRYVYEEAIGSMRYLSAYAPYYNANDEEVVIINLPYFARQAEQQQELTSLIIAILNIFMLIMVVAWLLAIAISNRLAQPLEAVRKGMERLDFSGMPEPIAYKGQDELGDLVREYNRIVVELAESAKQLAKSEREMAWREMARQIAHEIKNPLTPMRLSIQHLVRMKKDGREDWQNKFDDLAKSLIYQIDTLADTASEFSNFAKLVQVEHSKVNITELLREQLTLFAGYENIQLTLDSADESVNVLAHREQLQRVFTNLIKNAEQAIGSKSDGKIVVNIWTEGKLCYVAISDNGIGITEEQESKLFRPNFTTKSGGTGLGLAISKNIVETFGGSITYNPSEMGGARFTVSLPLV